MKRGSVSRVQLAIATLLSERRNGWNLPDKRYGNRISILGLWEPGKSFEYALVQGGFNGKSYIKVMDWIAHKAAQTLAETGRLTVVVQDNGPLHKSHLVRQKWAGWQEQGLVIFF